MSYVPIFLLSLSSLFYRLTSPSSLIFSTHYHPPPWAVHRPSIFPLKDRRASVFSINRSSSARIMWIKPAGDLFTASARGCSLLALARLHCQIVEKIVYGHATSFLNRFSPFSKECNLLTTTFAIQSFNNALKRPLPFNVFIHWHMLAMRVPVSLHLTFLSFSSTAFVAYLGFINLLVAQSHPVMLLFCQLLINRDKGHQPNSESPADAQSENRDCSKETRVPSGMCFVNLFLTNIWNII